jgi:hypothetical protein
VSSVARSRGRDDRRDDASAHVHARGLRVAAGLVALFYLDLRSAAPCII